MKGKLENWWFYHKWHLLIAIVAVSLLAGFLHDVIVARERTPDYQFAYVGADPLPDDTESALENALSAIGEDLNGDGRVIVAVNQYATYENIIQTQRDLEEMGDGDLAMQAEASYVGLVTDLSSNDSFFFLLDDPEGFQRKYEVLSFLDGTLPAERTPPSGTMYVAWRDSPLLSGLELGDYRLAGSSGSNQELLSGLYIARRGFWTDESCDNLDGCESLWARILGGELTGQMEGDQENKG